MNNPNTENNMTENKTENKTEARIQFEENFEYLSETMEYIDFADPGQEMMLSDLEVALHSCLYGTQQYENTMTTENTENTETDTMTENTETDTMNIPTLADVHNIADMLSGFHSPESETLEDIESIMADMARVLAYISKHPVKARNLITPRTEIGLAHLLEGVLPDTDRAARLLAFLSTETE